MLHTKQTGLIYYDNPFNYFLYHPDTKGAVAIGSSRQSYPSFQLKPHVCSASKSKHNVRNGHYDYCAQMFTPESRLKSATHKKKRQHTT